MARLIGLKSVWLPRVTLRNMTQTIMIHFFSDRLLIPMVVMRSWPFFQLDIKNVFLYGDLAKEVYIEQPPGFVPQGESGLVCKYVVSYMV